MNVEGQLHRHARRAYHHGARAFLRQAARHRTPHHAHTENGDFKALFIDTGLMTLIFVEAIARAYIVSRAFLPGGEFSAANSQTVGTRG